MLQKGEGRGSYRSEMRKVRKGTKGRNRDGEGIECEGGGGGGGGKGGRRETLDWKRVKQLGVGQR